MEILGNDFNEKNEKYICEKCNFICRYVSDWNRHKTTRKHIDQSKMEINGNEWKTSSSSLTSFKCLSCKNCNREFKTTAGLWKHNKKCINNNTNTDISELAKKISDKDELIMFLIKENTEFKNMMMEQQSMMIEVMKNGISNTNNSHNTTNTNSHNKAFNLQFFLNETCKNAMNINDFIDSIKLQLSDLEKFGEIGYVEGISNIITTNLKALDVTQRPVHCTDKKRETMYIKDQGEWAKENDDKPKLRKAIRRIANKNIKLLPQFREKYPDYNNSSSRVSDKYDKMVIEVMGGTGDDTREKENKIIHKISNITTIDKITI